MSMAGPCSKSMDNKSDFKNHYFKAENLKCCFEGEKFHTHFFLCEHKIPREFSADAAGDGDVMHTTLTPN